MFTITDREFAQLASYIHSNSGIYLKPEKKMLVLGRLHQVLLQLGLDNFTDYYEYLVSDQSGAAMGTLINKITTNHTFFMREANHFHYFKNHVLPYLKQTVASRDLRIWSAGCSTGEEPYCLAMLMDEYFGISKKEWDTKLLATDISDKVLSLARQGIYEKGTIGNLPKHWRSTYFTKLDEDRVQIAEGIRREIIFRRFNLMSLRFPFRRKFHVIFCRNVMIYFDNRTKAELIQRFYDWLEPGGYLFIGHSETIDKSQSRFHYVMPAVFRKN
ncbi:CheR family methyltransferase [Paenibacillus humicus]|uniref:CheR family methyltransferase n=1 Tax=Paenibacillus humicus TaxID=412861 RepID=UPI003D2A0740